MIHYLSHEIPEIYSTYAIKLYIHFFEPLVSLSSQSAELV